MKGQNIAEEEEEKILPIMKENYNGYKFSIDSNMPIYNSNMCLFFLSDYVRLGKIPNRLIIMNIASDYSKLGKMLDLCKGKNRLEIIEKTIAGEGIVTELIEKFNPTIEFTEQEMVSMLFYLGYLTIKGEELGFPILNIPNHVMKEIYSDYFLKIMKEELKLEIQENYVDMAREIATKGSIEKVIDSIHIYLNNLSNRDFVKFDEKYVKVIFYTMAMGMKIFRVKSEMEVNRKYPDLLLIPRQEADKYYGVMIEFKYLKKEEKRKLIEKQKEAKVQIEEYSKFEEIQAIPKLRKYTVIAVNDEIYVEEIK